MAYIVRRPRGWELRESVSTKSGPRSRTLASFRTLTPEVVEHARGRATGEVSAAELRAAARRAGARVAGSTADATATTLLRELAHGRRPRAAVHRLLRDALSDPEEPPTDSERAMSEWIGATLEQRGATLWDLLLLGDELPKRKRPDRLRFPRIESSLS